MANKRKTHHGPKKRARQHPRRAKSARPASRTGAKPQPRAESPKPSRPVLEAPPPAQPTEVVYGFHPVREVLRSRPHRVLEVVLAKARGGKRRAEIEELSKRVHVVVREAAALELNVLSENGAHQGMAARLERSAHDRHEGGAHQAADADLVVLVEDVQDPRNLGALLRVCEGAGVGRVLIRDRGSSPMTATVEKTATGAVEWLDIERITNSTLSLERLQADGFWVYGTASGSPAGESTVAVNRAAEKVAADDGATDNRAAESRAAERRVAEDAATDNRAARNRAAREQAARDKPPWELDLTGKVVLCFGGEEKGLRRRTLEACDATIALPMRGRIASLNLATAAAAVLYEAVRQRSQSA